jgi:hypothetical protein
LYCPEGLDKLDDGETSDLLLLVFALCASTQVEEKAMQAVPRLIAFALVSLLLVLPFLGAEDKDKKADPPKDEGKKTDVKKDEPAKKDAKNDEPAKKDAKNDEPAKKDGSDKKDNAKKIPGKLPPLKGKFKGLETDKYAAEKKMLRQPKVTATVLAVVEDQKSLRLKLTIPYVRIDQGQLQSYLNAQVSLMQATNAQGVYNAQNQMAQAAARLYQLDKVEKEVEWTATDEVKVRMKYPPPKFNDKGKPVPYTKKELYELRGNDKLPGFPAEFSDIKVGQIVEVTLLQNKNGSRPVKRGKDAEGETSADNLPKISMIIILADPPKN